MSTTILSIDAIKAIACPILRSFKVREARLFGSYAKGCATALSDIDIYVDSGLKGLYFFGLLEALSVALPVEVDLVDKQTIFSDGNLHREIMRTGVDLLAT